MLNKDYSNINFFFNFTTVTLMFHLDFVLSRDRYICQQ